MSSSNSSSEDEDRKNRLKEAVDPAYNFYNKSLSNTEKNSGQPTSKCNNTRRDSYRNRDAIPEGFNEFDVTQETKDYIAKRLYQRIDQFTKAEKSVLHLKEDAKSSPNEDHSGVRLLATARVNLMVNEDINSRKEIQHSKKTSNEMEKLISMAKSNECTVSKHRLGCDTRERKIVMKTDGSSKLPGLKTSFSLNNLDDDNDDDADQETKQYVAEQLHQAIDGLIKLKHRQKVHEGTEITDEEDYGVRLFTTSQVNITEEPLPKKRPRVAEDSDSSTEMERLSSVAVSYDWVMSNSNPLQAVRKKDR